MKFALFLTATLASAVQLASAETANLRASALIELMDDASLCMTECNEEYLGKKSSTKTKKIETSLTDCYDDCVPEDVRSARTEEVLECAGKCARSAEKDVKKAEKDSDKDSKKYKSCLSDCDEEEDKKKCEKKCDKDEDKRSDKDEEKALKSALKDADKCTDKCVAEGFFTGGAKDAVASA